MGGRNETKGEGKWKIKKTIDNGGVGFSSDVTLTLEPKFGPVPDQGCNTTTS